MKNSLSNNFFKIGEAAKIFGVSIKTLRRWEAANKISSTRTPGGTRFYSAQELNRIKPECIKPLQTPSVSTEELLRKVSSSGSTFQESEPTWKVDEMGQVSETADPSVVIATPRNDKVTKFLLGAGVLGIIALVVTSLIFLSPFKQSLLHLEGVKTHQDPPSRWTKYPGCYSQFPIFRG